MTDESLAGLLSFPSVWGSLTGATVPRLLPIQEMRHRDTEPPGYPPFLFNLRHMSPEINALQNLLLLFFGDMLQ